MAWVVIALVLAFLWVPIGIAMVLFFNGTLGHPATWR